MHDAHKTSQRDALENLHAYYDPALVRLRTDREREQLHDALEHLITQEEWLESSERDLARVAQQELRTVAGATQQELIHAEAAQVAQTLNARVQERRHEAGLLHERDQWRGMRHQVRRNVMNAATVLLGVAWLAFSFHVLHLRSVWWLIAGVAVVLPLGNTRELLLQAWDRWRPIPEPSLEDLRRDLNHYGPQTWA